MIRFGPNQAAALTWTSGGECRGIVLRREHGRVQVVRHWQSTASEDDSVGQELRRALDEMSVAPADILVAGGADPVAGCADVEFPALPERELRNSLQYELAYHAPIQQERLVWGYRVLGSRQSRQTIRLYYLREADWHRWLDELGALGRGIDALLPAHVCLDPALNEQPCFLPGEEGGGYMLEPGKDGRRTIRGVTAPPAEGAGAAEAPLSALPNFDAGALKELDADAQRALLPAILLAWYALGPELSQDRKTRIQVPYDLRPVRNRYSRLSAAAMAALLVLAGLYAGWREYAAAAAYQQALVERIEHTQNAIEEIETQKGQESDFEALAEEVRDLPAMPVSFGAALAELTQITPDKLWTQSLTWQEGRIDVQFATQEQDENIRDIVENSELFSSVSPQGVRVDRDGTKTIQLRMYATLPGGNSSELQAESQPTVENLDDKPEIPDATEPPKAPDSTDAPEPPEATEPADAPEPPEAPASPGGDETTTPSDTPNNDRSESQD